MDTTFFLITQILFAVLSLTCVGLIIWAVNKAMQKTEPDAGKRKRKLGIFIGVLAIWITFTTVGSLTGLLKDFSTFPPKMMIVLVVPLVSILILTFSKGMGRLLDAIPPHWIVYLQSFRIVVEILLWMLFLQTLLPEQMSFEGRNFDVLVGLTAPVFGFFVFAKKKWPRIVGVLWNIAGLGLLLNIVVIALLSMPTPFRYFLNEPSNTIVAEFPIIWLPGILVPIAYSMHFFSLRQLARQKATWDQPEKNGSS